jgi:hypothetical protein
MSKKNEKIYKSKVVRQRKVADNGRIIRGSRCRGALRLLFYKIKKTKYDRIGGCLTTASGFYLPSKILSKAVKMHGIS